MSAEKLLARLRNTKAGWSESELWQVLTAHGFLSREGKHTVYSHPEHSDLRLVVPRDRELKKIYPREAEKLIDKLLSRGAPKAKRKKR